MFQLSPSPSGEGNIVKCKAHALVLKLHIGWTGDGRHSGSSQQVKMASREDPKEAASLVREEAHLRVDTGHTWAHGGASHSHVACPRADLLAATAHLELSHARMLQQNLQRDPQWVRRNCNGHCMLDGEPKKYNSDSCGEGACLAIRGPARFHGGLPFSAFQLRP